MVLGKVLFQGRGKSRCFSAILFEFSFCCLLLTKLDHPSRPLNVILLMQVKIIGVEPYDANAMALSLHHGERVMLDHVGGFADGVAVKEVGEETFRICKELVDGVVLVSRDAICASIKVQLLSGFGAYMHLPLFLLVFF